MKRLIVYMAIMVCSFMALRLEAQVVVPDPVFRNFLVTNYPSVMNASQELIPSQAQTITGIFNCSQFRQLKDATGIEYFTNISKLQLQGDSLTALPNIDNLTLLQEIRVDTNYITDLPSLANQPNLIWLIVRENKLTTLPNLSAQSNLRYLYCDNNQITSLPSLATLTDMRIFLCADNKLTSLPSLSSMTLMHTLMIERNQLTTVPSLSNCTSLSVFNFFGNKISVFPDISGLTQVSSLSGYDNQLSSIPDLTAFPLLTTVDLSHNLLTFEDLIPSSSHPNFSSFNFMPQQNVGAGGTINLYETDSLVIDLNIDLGVNTNTYKWYRNNVFIGSTSTSRFVLYNITLSDAGAYSCVVENNLPALSDMQLTSKVYTVNISPCINLNGLSITVPDNGCKFPFTVELDASSFSGINPPFSYDIKSINAGSYTHYTHASFSVSQVGIYNLSITNSKGCQVHTKINIKRSETCDPVFYPDGDGIADTYYIESTGNAKIYDIDGRLIRSLQTPAEWDGRTDDGHDASAGLYVIVVNEQQQTKVTIIR